MFLIAVMLLQYKKNPHLFFVPVCFVICIYFGYIHTPLLEILFDLDPIQKNLYVQDQSQSVIYFTLLSMIAFNIGFYFLDDKDCNFDFVSLLDKYFLSYQKYIYVIYILLLLFDLIVFLLDLNGLSNFFISPYERGTHFGVSQFDRSTHFYLNIILTLKQLCALMLLIIDFVFLYDKNVFVSNFSRFHIFLSIVEFLYNQSQYILIPASIVSMYLFTKRRYFLSVLISLSFFILSYIFRMQRMDYNQLGLFVSFKCINNFIRYADFKDILFYNPINCHNITTYIFDNIDYFFKSYSNSFEQFIYILSPLPGVSYNHEFGVNFLSTFLNLDYGIPTPGLAHLFSGFKTLGCFFFVFVGLFAKIVLVKSTPLLRSFFCFVFIYSFILLNHSNIRAFWRIFSFPLYLFAILWVLKSNFVQSKSQ